MNRPEMQVRIEDLLTRYIRAFLDTAPDGGESERVQQIFTIVRRYFEHEYDRGMATSDFDRVVTAEDVMAGVSSYLHIESLKARRLAEMPPPHPWSMLSPEEREKVAARVEEKEELMRREGKKYPWDLFRDS